MDDRPFCRDACSMHANDQSKAVFSYAMTIMDEIYGWENEEKRVGFAACMWIYTQEVLTRGQIPTPEMKEYPKRCLMSIMLCMNLVCAGIFDNDEWVFDESLSTQHVEEVMGMELDYEIGSPCVVQWCMLWFSAPTRLNRTWVQQGMNIAKYHETLNMAIACAISRPLGGEHTPRSCMLASITKILHKNTQKVGE